MRILVGALVAVLVVLAVVLGWLALMEPRMIFFPHRELAGTPADRGWSFEEVWLRSSDGVKVHAWHVPAIAPRRTTVLFLHGNAGNISHRLEKIEILRSLGADVLILDYRGYGRSEGAPSEAGLARDARAAYDHLTGAMGVPPDSIVILGESLGTAVAARLASEVPIAKLVLEAPFTSVTDVARSMYPILPVQWIVRNRFDTLRAIAAVKRPILVLHSREDEVFPLRHAERLVEAAAPYARLVVMRGSHNEAFLVSDALYRESLGAFLAGREG